MPISLAGLLLTGVAFWGVGAALAAPLLIDRERPVAPALAVSLALVLGSLCWSMLGLLIWSGLVSGRAAGLLAGIVAVTTIGVTAHRAGLRTVLGRWTVTTMMPLLAGTALLCTVACFYRADRLRPLDDELLELGVRTRTYPTTDAALQHIISENFVARRDIEFGFRPGGVGLWSAGDRPLWFGFLDATLTEATGVRSALAYLFRFYCVHGLLLLLAAHLLFTEAPVSRLRRGLALVASFVTPFWWIQSIYTWPKLTGLVFAIAGGCLLCSFPEAGTPRRRALQIALASAAFGFSVLCHTNTIFAVAGALALVAVIRRAQLAVVDRSAIVALILPFVLIGQIHDRYVAAHTHPTQLLSRVNLCLGGSYVKPEPVISLGEACRIYWEGRGLGGVLADRGRSLLRSFTHGYSAIPDVWQAPTLAARSDALWRHALTTSVSTYGLTAVPAFLLALLWWRARRGQGARRVVLLNGLAIVLLAGFASLIAATVEIAPHTLPFAVHWLFALGNATLLLALPAPLGISVMAAQLTWNALGLASAVRTGMVTFWPITVCGLCIALLVWASLPSRTVLPPRR